MRYARLRIFALSSVSAFKICLKKFDLHEKFELHENNACQYLIAY